MAPTLIKTSARLAMRLDASAASSVPKPLAARHQPSISPLIPGICRNSVTVWESAICSTSRTVTSMTTPPSTAGIPAISRSPPLTSCRNDLRSCGFSAGTAALSVRYLPIFGTASSMTAETR
ncbi:hypothetical protein D3C73_1126780 [compost metagenome]